MDRPRKGSDKGTLVPEALAAVSKALSRLRTGATQITERKRLAAFRTEICDHQANVNNGHFGVLRGTLANA